MSKKYSLILSVLLTASVLSAGPNTVTAGTPAEAYFTTNQTWTPPAGLTTVKRVVTVGGGAAGSADQSGNFGPAGKSAPSGATGGTGWGAGGGAGLGGGGGQAGAVVDQANVAVSGPVSVTVGAAGTSVGTNGSQTCFGSVCATGGKGGGAYNDYSPVSGGQAGWGGTNGTGTKTSPVQAFGNVYTGQTSSAKTVTVYNNSGGPSAFQSIGTASNVNVSGDGCSGRTIASGASCTFNISVSPTSVGDLSRTVPVRTDRGILNVVVQATGETPPNCNLPWGGQIASGQSVTAYNSYSVPYGNSCYAETRTCNAGTLSGSYTASYCQVQPGASCSLPWGGSIADGQSVYAYDSSSVTSPSSCSGNYRTCYNGYLSGSGSYNSCSVQAGSGTWEVTGLRMNIACEPWQPSQSFLGGACSPLGATATTYTWSSGGSCGNWAEKSAWDYVCK